MLKEHKRRRPVACAVYILMQHKRRRQLASIDLLAFRLYSPPVCGSPRSRRHQAAAASHILSSRSQSYLRD